MIMGRLDVIGQARANYLLNNMGPTKMTFRKHFSGSVEMLWAPISCVDFMCAPTNFPNMHEDLR